jgi:CubicO group peptidase (beta-lactamase class C family)
MRHSPTCASGHAVFRTFAAAVMIDGRIVLENNASEPLCSCSTFKVAAATAVNPVVQEGMIDLDPPVLHYDNTLAFSDPVAAREVTLRHLLRHTSGLDDTDGAEPEPFECLGYLPFVARPARAFRYSNVAFDVGVLTAARRVGLSYEDFVRTYVPGTPRAERHTLATWIHVQHPVYDGSRPHAACR